jgi:hypothetical protein
LNFKYFKNEEILQPALIINQLRDNKVFKEFKKNDYFIIQLESGYSVTSQFNYTDSILKINSPNEFEFTIIKNSMFRLVRTFHKTSYSQLMRQFNFLNNWKVLKHKPTFNFIHIVCPHPPYVVDSNGQSKSNLNNFINNNFINDNLWEPKESYVEQLIYLNKQIENFINNLLNQYESFENEPIIILISDHGPLLRSLKNQDEFFDVRSKILFALKTPELNENFNFTTPINTFPYIFNNYLNYKINYLKDSLAGKEIFLRKHQNFNKPMLN